MAKSPASLYAEHCYQQTRLTAEASTEAPCKDAIQYGQLNTNNLAATYSNQGLILASKNRFSQAIASHTKAIALSPTAYNLYINRGNSYFAVKRYEEANSDYSTALLLSAGSSHQALYNRSLIFKALGFKHRAERELAHARLLAPDNLRYKDNHLSSHESNRF
ncbi:MAG: hypothetical protein KUG75_14410 [Pseudomonadales bacterium]|nr:hypothetical protein [Pseudomonadales bacterium]